MCGPGCQPGWASVARRANLHCFRAARRAMASCREDRRRCKGRGRRMDSDRVICPHCGAENVKSPIITLCSSCMQSLEGAEPAPAPPAPVTDEPQPAPAAEPTDFAPARSPEVAAPEPGPPDTEPPAAEADDFQPPRAEAPPLEIPTIAPGEPGPPEPAEPAPAVRPLKLICPRCRGANPPEYRHCALCGTPLPKARTARVMGESVGRTRLSVEWRPRPDMMRGETVGQTKWGAACGCVVMAFIFFVLLALSTLR